MSKNRDTKKDVKKSYVEIIIYNILGQSIATLVSKKMQAGYHEVHFGNYNIPSGIYIYKMQAGNFVEYKKMSLLK